MSKEYKIETIENMMEIPIDRFPIFLKELSEVLRIVRLTHEVNKMAGKKGPTLARPMIWKDDDKGEINVRIHLITSRG